MHPEHILVSWKLYCVCHPKVQPPKLQKEKGEGLGRGLPQQNGSKCLHSIILEPLGSCRGRTPIVNSGHPVYARHMCARSEPSLYGGTSVEGMPPQMSHVHGSK